MQLFPSRKVHVTWILCDSQKLLCCCLWIWKMLLLTTAKCKLLALDVPHYCGSQMVRETGWHRIFSNFTFYFKYAPSPSHPTLLFVFSQPILNLLTYIKFNVQVYAHVTNTTLRHTYFHHFRKIAGPFAVSLPPSLSPRKPLIYFLSLF